MVWRFDLFLCLVVIFSSLQSQQSKLFQCPPELGYCVSQDGKLRPSSAVYVEFNRTIPATIVQQKCIKMCLTRSSVAACQLTTYSDRTSCNVVFREMRTIIPVLGNKDKRSLCWSFDKCFIGNFKNTLGTQYVHVSRKPRIQINEKTNFMLKASNSDSTCLLKIKNWSELTAYSPQWCSDYQHLNFTESGFTGLSGDGTFSFYKRVGLELVGTWSMSYPSSYSNAVYVYKILSTGYVSVKIHETDPDPKLLISSEDPAFPATEGWYQIKRTHNYYIIEYMRLQDSFTTEVHLFCTQKRERNRYHCLGSYKGKDGYCGKGYGTKHRWSLQQRNVCFKSKGDGFGVFTTKYSGPFVKVRLVHRSGWVNCNNDIRRSMWGCSDTEAISIAVTDQRNTILFPKGMNNLGWSWVRGYDGRTSKELQLEAKNKNTETKQGMVYRLWYGGDLKNYSENDNTGESCVDVYSMITGVSEMSSIGFPIMRLSFSIDGPWNSTYEDPTTVHYYDFIKRLSDGISSFFSDFLIDSIQTPDNIAIDQLDILSRLRFSVRRLKKGANRSIKITADITEEHNEVPSFGGFCGDLMDAAKSLKLQNYVVKEHIKVINYGCCEDSKFGDDSFKGSYLFTPTGVDTSITLQCKYNSNASLTRRCRASNGREAKWDEPKMSNCKPKSKTTSELIELNATSHKSSDPVVTAKKLNKVITDGSVIKSPKDLKLISDIASVIIDKIDASQSAELADNVLDIYSKLLDADSSLIAKAEESDAAPTALIRNIETFSESLGTGITSSGNNISVSKRNIGFHVAKTEKKNVRIYSKFNELRQVSVGIDSYSSDESSTYLASAYIPDSALSQGNGLLYSQGYLKSSLFVDRNKIDSLRNESAIRYKVQSLILSISVGNNVSHLTEPIILQFKKRLGFHSNSTCSFWVFGSGTESAGRWDSTGCSFVNETAGGLVTCQCQHMTNFAILMDVYQTRSNPKSLKIISRIGCTISLVGLIITIIVYSYFKKLRSKLPSKILLCLCCSLTAFLIVFLAGIERTENEIACYAITGLLQYLLLASFAWMLIIGINLFQLLVLVFRVGDEEKFFLGVSLGAWLLPLVVVIATATSAPHLYGNSDFCFPYDKAAYFGLLLPMGVVLCINIVLLCTIIVKFARSKPVGEIRQNVNQTRIALSVTVLLGLTWMISVFATKEAQFTFQLLFCIFNSLQGFFICILYTLTNKAVHKELAGFFHARFPKYSGLSEKGTASTDIPLNSPDVGRSHTE